jgi:hypothetical protein
MQMLQQIDEFLDCFMREAPCVQWLLEKHITENDEVLLHIFLGNVCIWTVGNVLKEDADQEDVACFVKVVSFLDLHLISSNDEDYIFNAIGVSFAECIESAVQSALNIGINEPRFKTAYGYIKSLCPSNMIAEIERFER